jgi:hypothetical protein
MFTVNEFRYLTVNDKYMDEFSNWSRPYEYNWILQNLQKASLNNPSIHNTCCGTQPIHLQFAEKLNKFSQNITHSDIIKSDLFLQHLNIETYDLTQSYNKLFDIVICISTLEEMRANDREIAFNNLINQVNVGGHLLLTCDYPDVELSFLENILGQKIMLDNNIKLCGNNSAFRNDEFSNLNIIVIDLIKNI